MTQTQAILEHLKEKGGITSREAFELYGATRLADIIFRLRNRGLDIDSITRHGKNRFGGSCKYVEYRLHE